LKFVREGKKEITDEKENSAQNDPEGQSFGRVFTEGRSVIFRFVFQKPELGEPLGDHQEVSENPPGHQKG
jgi:hypothetical protein